MSRCRWDREAGQYLNDDGEPCRTDDYGDPVNHCTARRCARHIGKGELTCALHVADARYAIRRIMEIAPLMLTQALDVGVNSEAASLAGPAADPEAWSWHKIAAKQGLIWHASLLEDDDDYHPYTVLTRWEWLIREDYGPREPATTVTAAGEYLLRHLHRVAQDPGQDFRQLAREMRACREHLEMVLRNSHKPERGAPCPDCKDEGQVIRMTREFGHWCTKQECQQQFHYLDTTGDRWVCPRNRDHWRTHEDYTRWIEERTQVEA